MPHWVLDSIRGRVRAEARARDSDGLEMALCALCGIGKTLDTSSGSE